MVEREGIEPPVPKPLVYSQLDAIVHPIRGEVAGDRTLLSWVEARYVADYTSTPWYRYRESNPAFLVENQAS